jgi:hypothetical protein
MCSRQLPVRKENGRGRILKWARVNGHRRGQPSVVSMSPTMWVAVPAAAAIGIRVRFQPFQQM